MNLFWLLHHICLSHYLVDGIYYIFQIETPHEDLDPGNNKLSWDESTASTGCASWCAEPVRVQEMVGGRLSGFGEAPALHIPQASKSLYPGKSWAGIRAGQNKLLASFLMLEQGSIWREGSFRPTEIKIY